MATRPVFANGGCASGADVTISADCSGSSSWTGGSFTVNPGVTMTDAAPIVVANGASVSVGTLINWGTITGSGTSQGAIGVINGSSVAAIINAVGGSILGNYVAIENQPATTVGSITNSGTLSASRYVILNQLGTVGSITNTATGQIIGTTDRAKGIMNNGTVGTITNDGLIQSVSTTVNNFPGSPEPNPGGIVNFGAATTIVNTGTIIAGGTANAMGIYNTAQLVTDTWASVATLTNTGTIRVDSDDSSRSLHASYGVGIENTYGTIGTLNNSGSVTATGYNGAAAYGIENYGPITTLNNSGSVTADIASGSGLAYAIRNRGASSDRPASSIGTLNNSGTVTSHDYAIYNYGSIGTLNNTGTITGQRNSIFNGGTIGTIANSGTIQGDIYTNAGNLTFTGGTGTTFGTLTGISGVGTITANTATAITLAGGNILFDDNVRFNAGGTLTNNATTQVNRALTITGNYLQTSSASLLIGVSSTTDYGRLAVSGTANLVNGSAALSTLSGFHLSAGQSYTIVTATSLTASGFQVSTPGFLNTVSSDGGALTVTLNSWSSQLPAAGAGSTLGAALDTLASTSPAFQAMLEQIAQLPAGAQAVALQQLGTSQLTPQVNVSGATVIPTTNAIQQRQVALLTGESAGSSMAAGSDPIDSGLWMQLLGGSAVRGSRVGTDGYSATSYGITIGYDRHLTDDLVLGGAASWLHSRARGKLASAANVTEVDSYQFTGYGTWRPNGGPAFVDGLLGIGFNRFDQDRGMPYLGLTAEADYGGTQYQAKIAAGYDIALGRTTLTPDASLQYVHVDNNGYIEGGAGDNNLTVASQSFDSIESELGARLAAETETAWGRLKGDVRAAWVHSFEASPLANSAVLGGVSFVSSTGRPAGEGLRVTTGIDLRTSDEFTVRLEYDTELRSDFSSHVGLARVRYEF